MSNHERRPGAPTYHSQSARSGRMAKSMVARRNPYVETSSGFREGLLLGVAVAAVLMCLVLWLWVVPTMDQAVRMAAEAATLG